MTIFLTTDTHFGHKERMMEWCGRPENYQERLLAGFGFMTDSDTLIHLGDVCIGEDRLWNKEIKTHCAAKMILVRGNHDKKSSNWYLNHGWDFVCQSFQGKYFGIDILFTHRPRPWDGFFYVNIHGHLHNLTHRKEERTNKLNWLHSLEEVGYGPIKLATVVGRIISQRADKTELSKPQSLKGVINS